MLSKIDFWAIREQQSALRHASTLFFDVRLVLQGSCQVIVAV